MMADIPRLLDRLSRFIDSADMVRDGYGRWGSHQTASWRESIDDAKLAFDQLKKELLSGQK